MQIQVYKEIYHQPVNHINVPKDLHNQPFEVFFMPIVQTKKDTKTKRKPNPLLKGSVITHDDISPINDNTWELD